MPIAIDTTLARDLAPQLDEALEIVCNEFEGLDAHRGYHNAFARVLKRDPLARVLMLGTDQRDLFIPLLRDAIRAYVPADGHLFDFGAGDGQTFGYVADEVPSGTTVSVEEPNPVYLAAYRAMLQRRPNLRPGVVIGASIDELVNGAADAGDSLPGDGSVDLALGLHMIYFASDLPVSLHRMLRFVRTGGALFNVVTDEATAYSGSVLRAFLDAGGDTGDNDSHLSALEERRRLLAPDDEGGAGLVEALAARGMAVEFESVRQPSRMYGHSLADLLAIANISVLSAVPGTLKFESAAKVLRDRPREVDFRIEDTGPRAGMWSVVQPQWVTVVRRRSAISVRPR